METITHLPVDDLHESPFNPRKLFDEASLEELATDIRAQGRVLSPLLVRPRIPALFQHLADAADTAVVGYEIVFGHRRYRAAVLAGLERVPCMVRVMSDEEAKRAQISENLQRVDVHPIEEAEGFQALIDDSSHTADELAERFGKSRSYVYGRLKLLQACPEIRKACLAGEIGSEVALLIARLRTVKLQEKALGYIRGKYIDMKDGGQKSFRAVRELLNERFTLDLKSAIFDIEDEMLLPIAGNCVTCPKRSANAPEYTDVLDGEKPRYHSQKNYGADVCTDPDCFDAKKKAHLKREAEKLEAAGKTVLAGSAARAAVSADGEVKGAYIALKDVQATIKAQAKQAGGKSAAPAVVTIQDPRTGKLVQAVKLEDAKAAGVKVQEAPKRHAHDYAAEQRAYEERCKLEREQVEAELAIRLEMLQAVRDVAALRARDEFDLRLVARAAHAGVGYTDHKVLARLWPNIQHDSDKLINALDIERLAAFILDCALVQDLPPNGARGIKHMPETLNAAARHYGVDLAAIRAQHAKSASTPTPAARAPEKAAARAAKAPAKAAPAPKQASAAKAKSKSEEKALRADQKDDAGVAGGSVAAAEGVAA